MTIRGDLIFSADVEADGPIPGPYSMISVGICVAGTFHGDGRFEACDPRQETFYRELRPISDAYDAAALAVSGLDREQLVATGEDPAVAMADARAWVLGLAAAAGARPVLVGWPVAFDWMFLHWYWTHFCADGDPFGHSSVLDIKTLAWVRTGRPLDRLAKAWLPAAVQPQARHTHHALDDAVEQAELFVNLLRWTPPAPAPGT